MQYNDEKTPVAHRIKRISLRSAEDISTQSPSAEHWALRTETRPRGGTVKEISDAYFKLYRRAACEGGQLTLIAPAPTPSFKGSWGLRHLLEQDIQLHGWLLAALRLSALCRISLLLPQPTLPCDLQAAKEALDEEMHSLYHDGVAFDDLLALGITLSTPVALLDAAALCEEADFAVIDTDTLLRLSLASEPGSPHFEQLLAHSDAAVLRLLEAGVELLHRTGKFVAVSGRLADDPLFEGALLDIGTDAVLTAPPPPLRPSAFYL